MKKLFLVLALAGIVIYSNAQKSEFSKQSLSEPLATLNDQTSTLNDILAKHKGKTLIIEVWASWCGDCVKAMPKLKALQANHPEADYVFISMDKAKDKWEAGIQKHQLQGDHYWATDGMKGKFGQAIDLDWIPRYIIIDEKGKIVTYRAIETDFDKMEETLNQLKS
ncbi:TlpA family protein disulfide reductase [Flavobacterium sp. MAH-1]|uniref:TlpA family protein disulfide reductase n=1 Tax=Flavobacterium agri TaxID=2743471 RepID=A0A7Y9C7D0_9FLAO|nr:TlpA disulfide reductase family protein [Flavobacterium agri]NUY82235.1 TlpA family protein disulfide reductase [Flavobacterium agri]NYA72259.1 TlpA family protein disulfide reductase [Flavobacterium agri]